MSKITYPTVTSALRWSDHPAIVCGHETVFYSGLGQRVVEAVGKLRSLGIRPQDRVAVGAANSIEWVVVAHALGRMGAVLAPLNRRLTPTEIDERLAFIKPSLIIGDASFLAKVPDARGDGQDRVFEIDGDDSGFPQWSDAPPNEFDLIGDIDPSRLATIVSTSGSTGQPKGVCLTLANHIASAEASAEHLGTDPGDRWLVNLPLYHVGGLAVLYRAALNGATIVLHERFDADTTLAAIRMEGATHLSLVPTTLTRLLDAVGGESFPNSVRAVLVGGGPIAPELLRHARDLNLPVLPTYGLSETASQVATFPPGIPLSQDAVAGRPLPGCELEVRDTDGSSVSVGAEGEICVRGPMVCAGYWQPDGTVKPAIDEHGWLATGDVGVVDEAGFLSVRGRKDDMFISGGENIHPAEIEQALMRLPGIARAAVFGIDDPQWGQVPVGVVEVAEGARFDEAECVEKLRACLAGYKIPRKLIVMARLHVTALGKIDRRLIREHTQTAFPRF